MEEDHSIVIQTKPASTKLDVAALLSRKTSENKRNICRSLTATTTSIQEIFEPSAIHFTYFCSRLKEVQIRKRAKQ